MLYSENIKKAVWIAFKAHEGQVDKNQYPYILHPLHVAESMLDEDTTIIALLHDVIEDTKFTLEDLKKEGFKQEILTALKLLTHIKYIPYHTYIENLKHNELAKTVKISDLEHNMDTSRLGLLNEKNIKRVAKYKAAIEQLKRD